ITVTVEDTLPKGLKYIPGSSNSEYGEPNITENSNGTTKLVWNIYGCELDREVPTLTFKAEIDQESENGTEYTNTAIVSADKVEPTLPSTRTMTTTIKVINLSSYSLYKTTTTPIIERNGTIKYKVVAENKTDETVNDFQLLDILPYNGDGRGTNYTGTYKVSKINLKQTNVEGNETPNDNVNIRITQDESVRTGVNAKDEGLGTTSIWTGTESGTEINQSLTAYALTGTLPSHTKMEIEVIIETEGNKGNDIYINSVSGQTNKTTDEIVSGKVKTEVIKRILDGKVWFDNNANGVIDNGESLLKDIEVTLLNSDKTPAKNVFGENFEPINTDNNGYYKFEDMVKGDYIVQIKYDTDSNKKEITQKGIGNNITINNKFNSGVSSGENTEKAYTDVITTLNSISSPTLLEKYVNAGIKYKDAKVLVKHYIMLPDGTKTTNLVPLVDENESAEITIEGRINDNYETNRAGVPEYYEYVEVVGTPAGTMQTEETTVIYYYRLKNYAYTVNYYENKENGDKVLLGTKDGEEKTYGTEITVASEKINIPKYEYDSADVNGDTSKNKLTIGTTIANNVINIYYTKKTGTVIAKYIDKNTGKEIAQREEKEDKIDEEYKTDKKDIAGYTFVEDTGNTEGIYT
ncbi:MAG: MucBP domain-containing protein, partial [Methanosphaera sp.]|nr:MucBP domain-containing protein [Methanosphaera sp.]